MEQKKPDLGAAYNVVVTACRAYKGDANEHDAIAQSLLLIKTVVEEKLALQAKETVKPEITQ